MEEVAYDIIYDLENTHWWYRVRRELVNKILSGEVSRRKAPLKILDVGCGTGLLMKEMQKFGPVDGVDFSERAIAYCKERGLSPRLGSAEALPYGDNSFDAAIFFDVMEHLENDAQACGEVYRVLAPGGMVLVSVPAFMFLWSITDIVSQHYRRYTRKQVVARLKDAGFEVAYASYFNTILFLPIAAVRLLVRLLHIPMKSENTVGGPLTNLLLYRIFSLEARMLPRVRFPFGVSVLCIAYKK